MRILILVVIVSAIAGFSAGSSAQETPNFSGAWKAGFAAADSGSRVGVSVGSGWGESFTLIQEENSLTVERVIYLPRDYQPTLKFRYSLDGSESRNTLLMGRGTQEVYSTASWDEQELVITTTYDIANDLNDETTSCVVVQTLSLIKPRQAVGEASLVIETERCGILGGIPSTTRTVYVKN